MLLDIHVLIWYLTDDPQLPRFLKEEITRTPLVYVSAAVVWEIAIKGALGKLMVGGKPINSHEAMEKIMSECVTQQLELLPISPAETAQAPFLIGDHKDPFDRLLAAQAIQRGLPLVSRDAVFDSFSPPIERLWSESQSTGAAARKGPRSTRKRKTTA